MSISQNSLVTRTPESAFDGLEAYPFAPNWCRFDDDELGELTMHYVDCGPKQGKPVLLLHGQPSWSYLYRKMIPLLEQENLRVIAPDLIGFGKSDKPKDGAHHTYSRQVGWMHRFIKTLGLDDITLFCQDWGGLIGLRVVAEDPDLFAAVIASNTGLPAGAGAPSQAFLDWLAYVKATPNFDVGAILQRGSASTLTQAEVKAYNAPFPSLDYRAAPNNFPMMVPFDANDPEAQKNRQAWASLSAFDKPFVTAFSDSDPITNGGEKAFIKHVKGAANQTHPTIKGGGHFIQEDCPEELVAVIVDTIKNNA